MLSTGARMRPRFASRHLRCNGPGIPLEQIPALIGSEIECFPNGSGRGHAVTTAKPHRAEPQLRILRPAPSLPAEDPVARGADSLGQLPWLAAHEVSLGKDGKIREIRVIRGLFFEA